MTKIAAINVSLIWFGLSKLLTVRKTGSAWSEHGGPRCNTFSGFCVRLLKIDDASFSSYYQIRKKFLNYKAEGRRNVDRLTPPCTASLCGSFSTCFKDQQLPSQLLVIFSLNWWYPGELLTVCLPVLEKSKTFLKLSVIPRPLSLSSCGRRTLQLSKQPTP